jgi:hypothetical protein
MKSKTLCGIVAAMALGLSACSGTKEITGVLEGVPKSVGEGSGNYGVVAAVVEVKGTPILAYSKNSAANNVAMAEALLDYEINDDDNETVMMAGHFDGLKRYVISSIKVGDYQIDF